MSHLYKETVQKGFFKFDAKVFLIKMISNLKISNIYFWYFGKVSTTIPKSGRTC